MEPSPSTRGLRAGRFIAGPAFDWLLFIGTPLLSLALGFFVSRLSPEDNAISILQQNTTLTSVLLRTVIHSHLVIVFFRSHGNRAVFARHRLRFTLVPLLLMAASLYSMAFLTGLIVVAVYWDAYHSSMQTFGLGRIYDLRAGADVAKGRQLDIWLNHAIYIGPFIAGPMWKVMAQMFDVPKQAGVEALEPLRAAVLAVQPVAFWIVVVTAPALGLFYVWHTWRRLRRGEPVSWQKLALLASTAVTTTWAWGFNGFGQALLIVNVFHAVQYFAIVFWSEKDNVGSRFLLKGFPLERALVALVIVVVGVGYGFWFMGVGDMWTPEGFVRRFVLALTNVIAILHFWYDGFIWSVRKREV